MTHHTNHNHNTTNFINYDPEHQRTCQGCYQMLKTKEGILTSNLDFNCPSCHKYYRTANTIFYSILLVLILSIAATYLYLFTKSKKV